MFEYTWEECERIEYSIELEPKKNMPTMQILHGNE
jgi:hypothetical protein